MDLTKILAVSGKPGLFKVITQTKTGFIVESLTDSKRFPVFSHEKVSTLEEIRIFTTDEEVPLKDVLHNIYDKRQQGLAPDPKSDPGVIKEFFSEVLPDYDKERVYISDMKKVLMWYNILHEKEMLDFTEEEKKEEPSEESSQSPESTETKTDETANPE